MTCATRVVIVTDSTAAPHLERPENLSGRSLSARNFSGDMPQLFVTVSDGSYAAFAPWNLEAINKQLIASEYVWKIKNRTVSLNGGKHGVAEKSAKHQPRSVDGNKSCILERCKSLLCKSVTLLKSKTLHSKLGVPDGVPALMPGNFLYGGPLGIFTAIVPCVTFRTSTYKTRGDFRVMKKLLRNWWSMEYISGLHW